MTESHFDRDAANWDKKKRRVELAESVSSAIAELPLSTAMTAMDFGCGTGLVSLPLADRLGKIVAFDSSKGMIEVLSQKISQEKIQNIETYLGDIASASFSYQFDLIFTAMTLHHIEDMDGVLKKFSELLNPGGLTAIADLDAEDGSFHGSGKGEKHHGFHRTILKEKLLHFGFTDVSFTTVHQITKRLDDNSEKNFNVFLGTAVKK